MLSSVPNSDVDLYQQTLIADYECGFAVNDAIRGINTGDQASLDRAEKNLEACESTRDQEVVALLNQ
jgi:hypothetical protein